MFSPMSEPPRKPTGALSMEMILNKEDANPRRSSIQPTQPSSPQHGTDTAVPYHPQELFRLASPDWQANGPSAYGTHNISGHPSHYHQQQPQPNPHSPFHDNSHTPSLPNNNWTSSTHYQAHYQANTAVHSSSEHTALSGDYSSHNDQPLQTYRNQRRGTTPSEWQATERVSLRLAVQVNADPTSYSHFHGAPPLVGSSSGRHHLPPTFPPHSDLHQIAPKRGASEAGDVMEPFEPPKTKRKLNPKPKEGKHGPFGPKRGGYTTQKRSEVAQITAQNGSTPNLMYALPEGWDKDDSGGRTVVPVAVPAATNLHMEVQTSRCMSSRYKNDPLTRCLACIRRWAGDTCRFQGIRYFFRDQDENIVGIGFQVLPQDKPMIFPTKWNVPLEKSHILETKRIIAVALLPTLREELKHVNLHAVVYRARESEVRATCDSCMTSIFSRSWMCRNCGRESCHECYEHVKFMTTEPEHASQETLKDLAARRENDAKRNPTFLTCLKRKEHGAKDFSPMSRFNKVDLEEAISNMEQFLGNEAIVQPAHPVSPGSLPPDVAGSDDTSSTTIQTPPHRVHTPLSSPLSSAASDTTLISNGDQHEPPPTPSHDERTGVPYREIQRFADSQLKEEEFRAIWAKGDPLLVTGVGRKFKIDWSPSYFMKKYGSESCLIIDCQTDANKRITVKEFFSTFGQYEDRENCWKLKDWPPSTDFKTTFPELYEDFSQAVPIPNYVRRDGVLNIASHFPSNTVSPDLGPKMYNANANREVITKGSTRLHMDMADAVNVMTYAAPDPNGGEGSAAWDLFRAQDSDKIRKFLREKFPGVAETHRDLIHSQEIYIDDALRRELWQQYGVLSYRVYQKPGEAVFIPAGCAHQVRNISDCIKVAIDFVSPENVERCEKLTQEFRSQNQSKAWKEDILQLKTMMWFGWLSCCQQEERLRH